MATHADGSVDGSVARHKSWVIAAALPAVVALAVAVMLVTGAFPASGEEERSGDHRFHGLQAADGPQVTAEPLARSSFPDEISAKFRITPEGAEAAQVIRVKDPSEVLVAKITFDPGAEIGWHSHPGPAIAVVASGALTLVNADECVERV